VALRLDTWDRRRPLCLAHRRPRSRPSAPSASRSFDSRSRLPRRLRRLPAVLSPRRRPRNRAFYPPRVARHLGDLRRIRHAAPPHV